MIKVPQKLIAALLYSTLFGLCASSASAENEPTDNTTGGATPLEINFSATGNIPNGNDVDFYSITNTAGYTAIEISYVFNGSGPDTHRMRVLGPNGTTQLFNQITETGTNRYTATYTIVDGPVDAVYFIGVEEQSADGNKSYTLSVNGSFATIDPDSKTVPNTGETYMIDVTSSVAWTVIDIPSWATILPTSGFGDQMLTVTVPANALQPREATINIGGVFHSLMQEGIPDSTENEPTDNTTGGATVMEINSSATGSISNSDKDYYLIKNSAEFSEIDVNFVFAGSGPDTVRLRVLGPNGTTELSNQITGNGSDEYKAAYSIDNAVADAEYIICIEGNSADGSKSYTLTVAAQSTIIDKATSEVSSAAGSYTIALTSNTDWKVADVPTWATVSSTSGSGSTILTVTLEENMAMTSRSATLNIGGQSHVLTQSAAAVVFSLADLLGGTDLGGGAYFSAWFGVYFEIDDATRWVFHNDLGWVYLAADSVTSFWYYDHETSTFWWTSDTTYPSTYRNSNSTWYFFGTRNEEGERFFFNFAPEINAFVPLGNIFQD